MTPVLSFYLLPQSKATHREGDGPVLRVLKALATPLIRLSMAIPGWLLLTTWLMVAFAAWELANLGRNFLPQFDEGSIQVNVTLPPGSSLDASNQLSSLIDERFRQKQRSAANPEGEILHFVRRTGRAAILGYLTVGVLLFVPILVPSLWSMITFDGGLRFWDSGVYQNLVLAVSPPMEVFMGMNALTNVQNAGEFWVTWGLANLFLGVVSVLAAPGSASAQPGGYPRLANIYTLGYFDPVVIPTLAQWDLVVLNTVVTETELARTLNTAEALRAQPQMQRFIAWVKQKPPGFHECVARSERIRAR